MEPFAIGLEVTHLAEMFDMCGFFFTRAHIVARVRSSKLVWLEESWARKLAEICISRCFRKAQPPSFVHTISGTAAGNWKNHDAHKCLSCMFNATGSINTCHALTYNMIFAASRFFQANWLTN